MTKKSNLKKQEKDYLATGELLEFDAENYLESTACEEIDYPDDEQEAIEESTEWAREEELIRSEAIKQVSQFEISKLIFTSEFLSACKLTPTTKLVLLGLCNYYNPKNAAFFPSQKTLARIAGVCDRSAERAISELTKKGLIT